MKTASKSRTTKPSSKTSSTRAKSTSNSSSKSNASTASASMSMRDYKRIMRKQFTEIKKTATYFASVNNLQSMPTQERQAIRQMLKSVDSTHQKLVKWWGR